MASSFLVNNNIFERDTRILDTFTDWHIFENIFIKNKARLEASSTWREIDARYDYRPDLLSYEVYKEDFYYPVILIANNVGSMLQFKSDSMDNKCKIPDLKVILDLINEQVAKNLKDK